MRRRSIGDTEIRKGLLPSQTRISSLRLNSSTSIASQGQSAPKLCRRSQPTETRSLSTDWSSVTNFWESRGPTTAKIKMSSRRSANLWTWVLCHREAWTHTTLFSDWTTLIFKSRAKSLCRVSMIGIRISTESPTKRNSRSLWLHQKKRRSRESKTCQLSQSSLVSETNRTSLTSLQSLKKRNQLNKKQRFSKKSRRIN